MGQNLAAGTVSFQRDPILLVIKRCGGYSYFPAFTFSIQPQCSSHRAGCGRVSQLHPFNSGIFSPHWFRGKPVVPGAGSLHQEVSFCFLPCPLCAAG